MTQKERERKQKEFVKLWHYSQKLKEGGIAWGRTLEKMETLKNELMNQ